MKRNIPILLTLAALCALVLYSDAAAEGARRALAVCAATLVPSLLPFFALSNLLSSLGLAALLSGALGPAARRIFRVSGSGAQAFFLGVTGGYPVGAAVTARLRRDGRVTQEEAGRLLAFCNNSGPAFILGAAGGVFRSAEAGLLLYGTHIAAALCVGLILRGKPAATVDGADRTNGIDGTDGTDRADSANSAYGSAPAALTFAEAFPAAVSQALASVLGVCAWVVLFGAVLGVLGPFLPEEPVWRALAAGVIELGSGVASLAGVSPGPESLAAAAFLLGWGGLSVHCQTLGAVAGTDIKCARHLLGRALCGVLAAGFSYGLAMIVF